MSGSLSPIYGSVPSDHHPDLAAIRSELQQLTAQQFEGLAHLLEGKPLNDRVSLGSEPIPLSLLARVFDLPSPSRAAAVADEASLRRCLARLQECILDIHGPFFMYAQPLIQYIADAPTEERSERLDVARQIVRISHPSQYEEVLDLSNLRISRLPDLSWFTGLHQLNLTRCAHLTSLDELQGIPNLRSVMLGGGGLTTLDGLRHLHQLQELVLTDCAILQDLDCLRDLTSLREVDLSRCTNLTNLEGLRPLAHLQSVNLTRCTSLTNIHSLRGLPHLHTVTLAGCTSLEDLSALQGLPKLKHLTLCECTSITSTEQLQGLPELEELNLRECTSLSTLNGLQNIPSLKKLDCSGCTILTNLQALSGLRRLEFISLTACTGLTSLEGVSHLPWLHELRIDRCTGLSSPEGLRRLPNLFRLNFMDCTGLTSLRGLSGFRTLRFLSLCRCTNLTDVEDVENLPNLELMDLRECPGIDHVSREWLRERLPERCRLAPGERRHPGQSAALERPNDLDLREVDLDARPRELLGSLGLKLLARKGEHPSRWVFRLQGRDEQFNGYDAGGIKRDVVYRLVQNLFVMGQDVLYHYGEAPAVRPAAREADFGDYKNLGRVLSIPLQFAAPIGGIFEPAVYHAFSRALQDPDLLQDVAEARAQLAMMIYRDDLFGEELAARGVAGLSHERMEQLIERLDEVSPELGCEARSLALLIRPSERSQLEREALAYLLLRHPQLGRWLDNAVLCVDAAHVELLLPWLARQDSELILELEMGLRRAQTDLEGSLRTIAQKIAEIEAKETLSNLGRVRKHHLQKQLQQTPQFILPAQLRERTRRAVERQVQLEPDFGVLLKELVSRNEETIRDGLKQWQQQSAAYQEVGRAIQAMALGVREMWPIGGNDLALTPERLMRDLEGTLSIEDLKACCPLTENDQQDELAEQTHVWLMRWIDESTEAGLRRFCATVTGSGALVMRPEDGHPPIRVVFVARDAQYLPEARTCSRQLELPKTYPSYESFKEKLDWLVYEVGGFSRA